MDSSGDFNTNFVNLPKNELLEFFWKLRQLPIFYSVFKTKHENILIKEADKVTLWGCCLHGSALNVCAGLAPADNCQNDLGEFGRKIWRKTS